MTETTNHCSCRRCLIHDDPGGCLNLCSHPASARTVMTFAGAGYLNVPTGPRSVCTDCGWDFGPA